jgi:CPA2 family monovalent cation:H+ antiporter-2
VVATVTVGKTVAAVALVLLLRYPLRTALTVGASLAQIGEFSFILAALGTDLGLLPPQAQSLVLAAALISISLNPLVFAAVGPLEVRLRERFAVVRKLELRVDPLAVLPGSVDSQRLTGHVLLVGYGRVGRRIAEALEQRGLLYVVAEQNRELVERLRARGVPAVSGDAAEPEVLIQAHVARASVLVIAIADVVAMRRMVETARMLNPRVATILRTHSDEEAEILRKDGLGDVFMGEHELAGAMTRQVLARADAFAHARAAPAEA